MTDPRPTKEQFKAMSGVERKTHITPTLDGEPLSQELKDAFRARRIANRKPKVPKDMRRANGPGNAKKPASVSTVSGSV